MQLFSFFILEGLGSRLLFDVPAGKAARDLLRPWERLYEFGVMLLCAMSYYACCRHLSRLASFTLAQRAALAGPPSIQFCGLLGFMLFGVLMAFLHCYDESHRMDMLGFVAIGIAYWFYRRSYRALVSYLTIPGPSA